MSNYRMKIPVLKDGVAKKSMLLLFQQLRQQRGLTTFIEENGINGRWLKPDEPRDIDVLHQNKSEADHNMRGSIGTELTNKAFEVYRCEFIEDSETFKVTQCLSRRMRMRSKLFYQLENDGQVVDCTGYLNLRKGNGINKKN